MIRWNKKFSAGIAKGCPATTLQQFCPCKQKIWDFLHNRENRKRASLPQIHRKNLDDINEQFQYREVTLKLNSKQEWPTAFILFSVTLLLQTRVTLIRVLTHKMLLNHEIVCQARARVPDPAVGPVQADPNICAELGSSQQGRAPWGLTASFYKSHWNPIRVKLIY